MCLCLALCVVFVCWLRCVACRVACCFLIIVRSVMFDVCYSLCCSSGVVRCVCCVACRVCFCLLLVVSCVLFVVCKCVCAV